jgi:hypothetical protein
LNVDVIIHPNHAVGSYLAQLTTTQLATTPLILALPQRQYGGRIEVSLGHYLIYDNALQERRRLLGRDTLRALIIDDSVLSGSSLFTMAGAVRRLNVELRGFFVLVNRLPTEVSLAVKRLGFPFAYLYRVHMPIGISNDSPDHVAAVIRATNDGTRSGLAAWFGQEIGRLVSTVKDGVLAAGSDTFALPPVDDLFAGYSSDVIDRDVLHHIIINLLFHHDLRVIDLETRVAIAYNFIEVLAREGIFWDIFDRLFVADDSSPGQPIRTALLERLIVLFMSPA